MDLESKQMEVLNKVFPDGKSRDFLFQLINSLPHFIAILNEDRRLIYSNQAFSDTLEFSSFEKALYLRPGELFKCVNSEIESGGCGMSEACELCGAMRAMEDSRKNGKIVTQDFKILAKDKDSIKSYNFKISSTPFESEDKFYFVITLEDISANKRKSELERIFFHDIMNSISSFNGLINLIKTKHKLEPVYLDILEASYNSLFDIVNEQKQFSLAEKGDLPVNLEELHTRDLLLETILHFTENETHMKRLRFEEGSDDIVFKSDGGLLKRILINMIKNALEATGQNDMIRVGAKVKPGVLRFWVNNPGVISNENRLLIFERSFSTKGSGRGLGTFSMKLLGENYLGGSVRFNSTLEEGTTFWIDLPI